MKNTILLIGLYITSFTALAGNLPIVTVGSGANCDFDKIQDAINSSSDHLNIRLTNQEVFRENIIISNNLRMVGGYNNCSDAVNNIPSDKRTTISGDINNDSIGDGPVLLISNGEDDVDSIQLSELKLINGYQGITGFAQDGGGGISILNFTGAVQLRHMVITGNSGSKGGGIAIKDGYAYLTIEDDTSIVNNSAVNGGGIWCSGVKNWIGYNFPANTTYANIANNTATADGGGVYLKLGCMMTVRPNQPEPDSINQAGSSNENKAGIAFNQANDNGGGVYLQSGAAIELGTVNGFDLDPNAIINISDNIADNDNDGDGNGGGIYATDGTTTVVARNIHIGHNTAQFGGGIYLTSSAGFEILPCSGSKNCNLINFNTGKIEAGGIYVNDSAQLHMVQTVFEDNRSDEATAIKLNQQAVAILASNVFSHNGADGSLGLKDNYVIQIDNQSGLLSSFNTFADNHAKFAVFAIRGQSELQVQGNIIDDASTGDVIEISGENETTFRCLVVHESKSFSGNNILTGDPDFVNRAQRDYHIKPSSPAVDICSTESLIFDYDIDGEFHAWDDPNTPFTKFIIADAGADETYASDIIFKDGFEQ